MAKSVKFNIPKRVYTEGPKKMVSYRLPEALLTELERLAIDKGWGVTDVITTVLDQYVQYENGKK